MLEHLRSRSIHNEVRKVAEEWRGGLLFVTCGGSLGGPAFVVVGPGDVAP